jgi:transcriptional regulator with XRE-family HTH domain
MDNLTAMSTFIENVRNTLAARGLTIQDLANLTGIARPNLSKILSSKENVTLDRAERIANALGISLSDLLREPAVSSVT